MYPAPREFLNYCPLSWDHPGQIPRPARSQRLNLLPKGIPLRSRRSRTLPCCLEVTARVPKNRFRRQRTAASPERTLAVFLTTTTVGKKKRNSKRGRNLSSDVDSTDTIMPPLFQLATEWYVAQ